MNTIERVENFVRDFVDAEVAHDFEHVHRVRNWALKIAAAEDYSHVELVEAAALLHDIGLTQAGKNRRQHGELGAEMARGYLLTNALFSAEQVEEIANAIRYHCTNRGGEGKLLDILRDADIIDSLGAIGVIRTVRYQQEKPDYDPTNVRGVTWQMTAKDFDERFDKGLNVGENLVDYINFQISCYDNMATETGKAIARPLTEFNRCFVLQLQSEVRCEVGG